MEVGPVTLSVHLKQLGSAQRVLLLDLRFDVAPGEILTLMGASGSGKSSVLAAIAGTLHSVAEGAQALRFDGTITLNGTDLTPLPTARRGIGLLFQDPLLFAHMTVAENLLFAVPSGPRAQRLQQVEQALLDAELAGYGERDPATLSGGQRARVALMRALLAQPRALLLDEPFSKLDAALRDQFRTLVFDHIRAQNIPAVLVTHDAADIADPARLLELPAHA
jgi:putative thiamine transport system ATP-binding protein